MSAPFRSLAHLGLRYTSPRDLAAVVRPYARAALDGDRPVVAVVDDDVAAALRASLGPAAERIRFPPRGALSPEEWLARLQGWSGSGHRALVVGQYSAVPASDQDRALMEDGVNLLLRDRALTLLCVCPETDQTRRTHPAWLSGGTERPEPGFRPPADRCPVPAAMWGRPVLRTSFRSAADLARIRADVAGLVATVGLRGTAADAALLAVHEAAALACRSDGDAALSLEIRTTARSLFGEVHAPWRHDAGPGEAEALRRLRWFCHRAVVHDGAGHRTIRVLTDLRGPPVERWLRH